MSAERESGSPSGTTDPAEAAVVETIRQHGGACFVWDVYASGLTEGDELELALAHLADDGRIVLQHNFCADPHFAADDLRAIAVTTGTSDDERSSALAACDRLWQRWMANFLASHRCT